MSNIVDFIGTESISQLFDLHKLNNWRILRKGEQGNTIPVAEDIKSRSPAQGKNSFIEWSRIILMGNPKNNKIYEIEIFNVTEEESEEGTNRKRTQKVRFIFQLVAGNEGVQNYIHHLPNTDIQTIIENEKLKMKIDQLSEKIAQLEAERFNEEEEDDDDDEEESNNGMGELIGAILANIKGNKSASMNGTPKENINDKVDAERLEYQKRLTAAIKKLRANDKKLLQHLEKLADISENNKPMFNMLLNSLDGL